MSAAKSLSFYKSNWMYIYVFICPYLLLATQEQLQSQITMPSEHRIDSALRLLYVRRGGIFVV